MDSISFKMNSPFSKKPAGDLRKAAGRAAGKVVKAAKTAAETTIEEVMRRTGKGNVPDVPDVPKRPVDPRFDIDSALLKRYSNLKDIKAKTGGGARWA